MKRIVTLFGVAVMAAFAFSALVAVAASAEATKILPEPAGGAAVLTDTAEQSEPGHLLAVGGLEVKCKKGSGEEEFTSANEGKGGVTFKECTSALSTTCTGKTAAKEGEIPAKGAVHFWLALLMLSGGGTELIAALVFLIEPAIEFTCVNKAKTIKNEVVVQAKSCIAAKDLTINSLVSKTHEEFTEIITGETSILEVLPAGSTTEIKCLPTETLNGGAAELFAVSGLFLIEKFKKNGSAIMIELMNP